MGLSFRLASMKRLSKKMKRSKVVEGRAIRNRRALFKPDSRPEIPEDVLMAILARLPAESLMRFKCVSKLWLYLISSRYLTNLFLVSPSPQRRLFMYLVDKNGHALLSASPKNCESDCCGLDKKLTMPGMGGCFVNALRGLMCFRMGTRVRICNLTTKQNIELPLVSSSILKDDSNMWNHFGYDPIRDEYKVFSLVWEMTQEHRVARSEHHVLVLGHGPSWRRTTQSVAPHRPYSQGISIDSVLYYGAWTSENTCVVVSFDLRSEEFGLIELPFESNIIWDTRAANLINYGGKIAVFDYTRLASEEGSIDLWVFEDAGKSRLWSNKKTFALPVDHIRNLIEGEVLMHGTSHKGEIRCFGKSDPSMHIICDLERSKMIGAVILSSLLYTSFETESLHMNYWDDFESIMYLEA